MGIPVLQPLSRLGHQFLTRAAARDKELPSWSVQIGRFPPLPLPHDGIADSRHVMAISPLIQYASRGETRSAPSDSERRLPILGSLVRISWCRREGCPGPDPAQHQDPDFLEGHQKILIEFFVSLVEMQSGNCWSTLLALGPPRPASRLSLELESSSLRFPMAQSPYSQAGQGSSSVSEKPDP